MGYGSFALAACGRVGGKRKFAAGSRSGCFGDDNRDAAVGRYGLVLRSAHQSAVGDDALDEGKGTASGRDFGGGAHVAQFTIFRRSQ